MSIIALCSASITPSKDVREITLNVDDTAMIPLCTAYYNLVRKHQAINKTRAKAAGMDLKLGRDKWNGLIKCARKYKKTGGKIRVWEE